MMEEQYKANIKSEYKQSIKKHSSHLLVVFVALFFSAIFFIFGFSVGKSQHSALVPFDFAVVKNKENDKNNEVDFTLFWKVWDLVKEKYVDHDSLKAQDMINGAINGMLSATGDPYTVFLDEEKFAQLNEELNGSFEGIGAEIGMKDDILTIIAPLEDSPAQKSGLRAGDKIIEIEGESTGELTIDEAVKKMRGPKGTQLHLKIFRVDGENMDTKDITVVRDTIHIDSVHVEFLDDNIAHIKLMQFGEDTITEFNRIISQIKTHKSKGIVLDMRNDPGGILHTAVVIASKFLPNNSVVVMEEDAKKKRTNLYTSGAHPFIDMPIVILLNEGSASASEILAGALRDNRSDVTIVGKQSFGKGSVQELIPTSTLTAAKITVAKWLTPNGEQINKKGIKPNVEVEYTSEDFKNDKDPQLDKAIEILKEKISRK
jgi:carboxyl-terminal processing protease